ncbi:MAG: proline--tRNA ligase, partial [Caldiserica bacterium]
IYESEKGDFVLLIPGEREVNKKKLDDYIGCETKLASEDKIVEITGSPLGFAGPVGLKKKVRVIADISIKGVKGAISGANKKDYHLKNICEGRDFVADEYINIVKPRKGDKCAKCGSEIVISKGIEVGHTFKLGRKYSEPMNLKYRDKDGKEKLVIMGCYGIGVSRMVAAAIEQSHDEKGIIWKLPLSPFDVEIISLNYKDEEIKKVSDRIYNELKEKGIDVLLDERGVSPGIKFNDCDLIGITFRIVIGKKLKEGKVEISKRDGSLKLEVNEGDAVNRFLEIYEKEIKNFSV